ncbi:MAG: methionyl-tRNA formyltransferase [Candidatus Nanopelagicales bacterium]|jgi:methionyl-tRNA formyltransferase|nr:methionyl-tRNA formyltransferase [Candidatus Nanopelagicales bacterium]MCU0296115.1 methionyl-tRNA formyltransferase [Candidatus Nanopelagicales bacterium]MCU0298976.1 methionyl-tRNA formyltransferase [Candidatus Nanopelagicales bacterium]
MRLVFAGTPEVAVVSLEALIASRHDVVAVVTRPDAVAGRGHRLTPSPVSRVAEEHGIPTLKPAKPNDPQFIAELQQYQPDCCPVVAYGALIPQPVLDIPAKGWVNLHFSLLPAWRGAAPVQRAVMAGDDVTGAAVFQLEAGMDTGPVFGVVTETIGPRDTSGDLLGRLAHSGAGLLVKVLDGIEDATVHAVPQSADGVSLAPKITVDDARVRWDDPALAVDRRIRACTPAPGAWTMLDDVKVKLQPVSIADESLAPGQMKIEKARVLVGTLTQAVELGVVQPAGKKAMAATDWARGLHGDRLVLQ